MDKIEYIKRQDVINLLNYLADGYNYIEVPTEDFIKYVKDIPAEKDLVKVIRCQNCRYEDSYHHCKLVNWWGSKNEYCSKAKLKGSLKNGETCVS